jgi:hypothetical protein
MRGKNVYLAVAAGGRRKKKDFETVAALYYLFFSSLCCYTTIIYTRGISVLSVVVQVPLFYFIVKADGYF